MDDAVSKAQYMLKANIYKYCASKMNFVVLFILYFLCNSFDSFLISYIAITILFYKFIFSVMKVDNPYKIFLLKYISDLIKNVRKL